MALAIETKVMTAHVLLPLAQKVDELAARFDHRQSAGCTANRPFENLMRLQ
jgi:hypothetical protein